MIKSYKHTGKPRGECRVNIGKKSEWRLSVPYHLPSQSLQKLRGKKLFATLFGEAKAIGY